jgi:GT2 family glycosyltransferase
MKENLYIIILNWNGNEDTISCLKSVKKSDYKNYTVILIDNGSKKSNLLKLKEWVAQNYKKVVIYNTDEAILGPNKQKEIDFDNCLSGEKLVLIENNENLGFAGGNNIGLKYFLNTSDSYAMLLNNDTEVNENTFSELISFMEDNKDFVAVTPQIRYFEPNDVIWNCGGEITWFGNRRYYYESNNIAKVPQNGYKEISFITGCALLFKPKITGILSEKFFFGEEDLEFSFRQKADNKKMACCFSSILYHKVSRSVNAIKVDIVGHTYLHYISRLINIKQYSNKVMFIIRVIINLSYAIPMVLIRYKFTIRQTYYMIYTIIKELNRVEKIDRDYCFNSLKENFNRPPSWIN